MPVEVGEWRFASHANIRRALDRGEQALGMGRKMLARAALPNGDDVERSLHKQRRSLERLRRLTEIYGPYTELDCAFDDRETPRARRPDDAEDRTRLPFDTAAIDWETYMTDVHLPALRRLVSVPRPARSIAARMRTPQLAEGPPAIAFFDVEGVVLDATIVHAYALAAQRDMPHPDRELWLLGLGAKATAFRAKDRVSRAAFNRDFYQRYANLPAQELRDQAADSLSDLHPPADAPRRRAPHPPAPRPRRPRRAAHGRAGLPRRAAAAPRRRPDRRAARRARRASSPATSRSRRSPPTGGPRWPPRSRPSTASRSPSATPTATRSPTCRCSRWSGTRTP